MEERADMTNNHLPNPDYEELVRILKGYKAQQEATDLVRRARHARIQKAKEILETRMQQHYNTYLMRGDC